MKVRILRYWLVLLAVCLVLCGAIFVRRAQGAGPFVINSNADTSDANPGDGVCATAANVCTLRAAIQEVNKLGGAQGPAIITFDLGGGGNVAPTSGLPFITSPVIIDGQTRKPTNYGRFRAGLQAVSSLTRRRAGAFRRRARQVCDGQNGHG